jgi:hypothetical protein
MYKGCKECEGQPWVVGMHGNSVLVVKTRLKQQKKLKECSPRDNLKSAIYNLKFPCAT